MVREVKKEGTLYALHIAHDVQGTMPVSDALWPLQMLMIERSAGSVFPAHMHRLEDRQTTSLQEALVVLSGRIEVTIYTRDAGVVESFEMGANECVFLVSGGWGITVLEDARMYEFKNGPHHDDKVML
ncbi:MAG: hypothetical protein RLZZ234_178 [Candidatus Parcubacteria bacterium]|jgi:hypothetical protein